MVLEKRSPIKQVPQPTNLPPDVEGFVILETTEFFVDYESYADRRDYLEKRIFTCEITGKGGLTYKQALQSETNGASRLETSFPEALKAPILRFVQFNTQPKIDNLITDIMEHFKLQFYPGEAVVINRDETSREEGVIRDKATFARMPDFEPGVRYTITVKKRSGNQSVVNVEDPALLSRSRRIYSRTSLKTLIKNCTSKDSHTGAVPCWLIKEEFAKQHAIPTDVPVAVAREPPVVNGKEKTHSKKRPSGEFLQGLADKGGVLAGIKKGMILTHDQIRQWQEFYGRATASGKPLDLIVRQQQSLLNCSARAATTVEFQQLGMPNMEYVPRKANIKFPCDDLDVPIEKRKSINGRPMLRFLDHNFPYLSMVDTAVSDPRPVTGELLHIWSTFNVFSYFFIVDHFSLDDLVQAMAIAAPDVYCKLFDEIHCAALKAIVDEEGDVLPKSLETRDRSWQGYDVEDGEPDEEDEEEREPTPPPHFEAPRTRGSTRRSLAAEAAPPPPSPPPPEQPPHFAWALQTEEEWIARMSEADFADESWTIAMTGFLYALSLKDAYREQSDRILAKLVPTEEEATYSDVRQNYLSLDLADRAQALHLLLVFAAETTRMKEMMEDMELESTGIRKSKLEIQSLRKPLIKKRIHLEEQRKLLRPDTVPEEEDRASEDSDADSHTALDADENGVDEDDAMDDTQVSTRSKRGREKDLKRKREEDLATEREKFKKIKATNSKAADAAYEDVLRDLKEVNATIHEYDQQIAEYDLELRVRFTHRTRLLGKDRYLNHYFWLERSGMPPRGNHWGATALTEYMNGCIWVQGPDPLEADNYINLSVEQQRDYEDEHNISLEARRQLDEGDVRLANATEFGYLDKPEDVEQLLNYLDERGERERRLRKELKSLRSEITKSMERRRAQLEAVTEAIKSDEADEPVVGVATRRKNAQAVAQRRYPCMDWDNAYARHYFSRGSVHSDGGRPKQAKRRTQFPAAIKTHSAEPAQVPTPSDEPESPPAGSGRGGRGGGRGGRGGRGSRGGGRGRGRGTPRTRA